jgi:hypothetical protein
MVLTIRGTCNENVLIGRDDVTLQGDPKTGAMVNGPSSTLPTISVNAARVVIDRLTVTGGGQGIQVQGLWSMAITNCQIQNTALSGIYLRFGHARIVNNTIQNAGRNGVELTEGSAALLDNNLIQYNTIAGVQAQGNSTVNARGNTISANGSNGVALTLGSQGSPMATQSPSTVPIRPFEEMEFLLSGEAKPRLAATPSAATALFRPSNRAESACPVPTPKSLAAT